MIFLDGATTILWIVLILVILIIIAGAGIGYYSFISKDGSKKLLGLDVNFLDFTQLSDDQEEEFLKLVGYVNTGIVNGSARSFRKGINSDALEYVCKSFNCSDANDFVQYCGEDLEKCGSNISASEKAYLRYEIKDCKDLASNLEKQCGKSFDISEAYLVECLSTYEGSDGTKEVRDNYVFMKSGDSWSLILLHKNCFSELGLDD